MERRFVILGFGSVAKTLFPLLVDHFDIKELLVVDCHELTAHDTSVIGDVPYTFILKQFTSENMKREIESLIHDDDLIFDFMGCTDSTKLILATTSKKNVLYINTALEEFLEECLPTTYELYQRYHNQKNKIKSTACIDCGANPGLITHFSILACKHMAEAAIKRGVPDSSILEDLLKEGNVAKLATQLQIEQLHISEYETLIPTHPELLNGKTVSAWCTESYHLEWNTPSEMSIGSSDIDFLIPENGYNKVEGQIPDSTNLPFPTHAISAIPSTLYVGRIVRHPETLEISQIFFDEKAHHCPTVAFVYHPSKITLSTLKQEGWEEMPKEVFTEEHGGPLLGIESMGACLISARPDIPPRWYGSLLSSDETRRLKCCVNATTLQVAASVLAHILLAINYPEKGPCMPHDFDSEEVMKIAKPYLGIIYDDDLPFRLPSRWRDLLSDVVL